MAKQGDSKLWKELVKLQDQFQSNTRETQDSYGDTVQIWIPSTTKEFTTASAYMSLVGPRQPQERREWIGKSYGNSEYRNAYVCLCGWCAGRNCLLGKLRAGGARIVIHAPFVPRKWRLIYMCCGTVRKQRLSGGNLSHGRP